MNQAKLFAELDRLATMKLREVDKIGVDPSELDFYPELADIETIGLFMADTKRVQKFLEERIDVLKSNFAFAALSMGKKMDEAGMEKTTITGAGSFKTDVQLNVSIPADNKDEAFQWLRDNGMEPLIKLNVNAASLKSAMRGHLEEGGEIPDQGTIRTFTQLTGKLTRLS